MRHHARTAAAALLLILNALVSMSDGSGLRRLFTSSSSIKGLDEGQPGHEVRASSTGSTSPHSSTSPRSLFKVLGSQHNSCENLSDKAGLKQKSLSSPLGSRKASDRTKYTIGSHGLEDNNAAAESQDAPLSLTPPSPASPKSDPCSPMSVKKDTGVKGSTELALSSHAKTRRVTFSSSSEVDVRSKMSISAQQKEQSGRAGSSLSSGAQTCDSKRSSQSSSSESSENDCAMPKSSNQDGYGNAILTGTEDGSNGGQLVANSASHTNGSGTFVDDLPSESKIANGLDSYIAHGLATDDAVTFVRRLQNEYTPEEVRSALHDCPVAILNAIVLGALAEKTLFAIVEMYGIPEDTPALRLINGTSLKELDQGAVAQLCNDLVHLVVKHRSYNALLDIKTQLPSGYALNLHLACLEAKCTNMGAIFQAHPFLTLAFAEVLYRIPAGEMTAELASLVQGIALHELAEIYMNTAVFCEHYAAAVAILTAPGSRVNGIETSLMSDEAKAEMYARLVALDKHTMTCSTANVIVNFMAQLGRKQDVIAFLEGFALTRGLVDAPSVVEMAFYSDTLNSLLVLKTIQTHFGPNWLLACVERCLVMYILEHPGEQIANNPSSFLTTFVGASYAKAQSLVAALGYKNLKSFTTASELRFTQETETSLRKALGKS